MRRQGVPDRPKNNAPAAVHSSTRALPGNAAVQLRSAQADASPVVLRLQAVSRAANAAQELSVQRAPTAAGEAYLASVQTDGTWGSYVEAHAIAAACEFSTHIFRLGPGQGAARALQLVDTIGAGPVSPFSLLWTGNHYQVLGGNAALNGQQLGGHVVHDPIGDGNCLYEAMYYIVREGDAAVAGDLRIEGGGQRAVWLRRMRSTAAQNIPEALANLLGEEMLAEAGNDDDAFKPDFLNEKQRMDMAIHISTIYKAFDPAAYFIRVDKKKPTFYRRGDQKKEIDVNSYMRRNVKGSDRELRDAIGLALARDRSYSPVAKAPVDLVEEPFVSLADDVAHKRYTMKATAESKIRKNSGEKPFEAYSDGMSVAEAVEEAVVGLDLSGSISFKYSRHDFQPTSADHNLQIQLGGSKAYRVRKGDTSSTLVVVSSDLLMNTPRWKLVVQAAHRLSFANTQKVEIMPAK